MPLATQTCVPKRAFVPVRAGVAAAVFFAGFVVPQVAQVAHADVQSCVAASEKGQRARGAGKLREAREQFIICGVDSCPQLVRKDCVHWNTEIAVALPTVVFGAHDSKGKDLFDVTVTMDGESIVKRLDGKSVTIDPGKHVFKFDSAGLSPVTTTVLVKEGERARVIDVTFDPAAPPPPPPPTPGDDKTDKPDKGPTTGDKAQTTGTEQGHTVFPWVVVGLGAVGVAVGAAIALTAPALPANCDKTTKKCTRGSLSQPDFSASQTQAGNHDSQPLLGFAIAGVGLGVVAVGLIWHFVEPTGADAHASGGATNRGLGKLSGFAPWTTGRASGVGFVSSF